MYEINFHTKISSAWFTGLSIVFSSFSSFGQFESTKLSSIRKVLDGKVRNFSPTKISSFTVPQREFYWPKVSVRIKWKGGEEIEMQRWRKRRFGVNAIISVTVPQSWPRWAHSVSHTRVTVERGIKFGIDQNRDAAVNCWRLAPWLMPAARRRHPRFFGHFWPSVWPSSRSNFDLGPSPLDSMEKNLSYQSLWFWSAVFL